MATVMTEIEKPSYNEEYRTMQFCRPDGAGQLIKDEVVTGAEVVVTERATGLNVSDQMVAEVGPYDQTQVLYKLKGGVPGRYYLVAIHITTSLNQKLSDTLLLKVLA